ncbi:MAG: hypothetical protein HC888_00485 [Candidatus Competibacteraceae bacterium]|nr:hypothetical protein [Candidatus Competibacteraceae bacterium]
MIFLGRFRSGDEMVVPLCTTSDEQVPVAPDEAPNVTIYSSSDKIVSYKMPAMEKSSLVGNFRLPVFLSELFPVGQYTMLFTWFVGSTPYTETGCFVVETGGDPNGSVIAMHCFERPNARYLVHSTDAGRIFKGKNPRLR